MLGNPQRYTSRLGMDTRTGMRDVGQESLRRRARLFDRLGVNGHGDYYPSTSAANSYPNPSNDQR